MWFGALHGVDMKRKKWRVSHLTEQQQQCSFPQKPASQPAVYKPQQSSILPKTGVAHWSKRRELSPLPVLFWTTSLLQRRDDYTCFSSHRATTTMFLPAKTSFPASTVYKPQQSSILPANLEFTFLKRVPHFSKRTIVFFLEDGRSTLIETSRTIPTTCLY